MKKSLIAVLVALSAVIAAPARAQSEASAVSALSALPLASVVVVGASATAGASLAVPAMLSAAGAVFVIKAIEVGALSTVYVLERASDGARVSVEVAGRGMANASMAAGTMVTVSVIGAGVILSVAGEAIAFVPNALGRALLHNERLTD
ncbi:hypothetical protein [Ramlibacter sp. WS9]|uniref:hypothetical protein n=1 Tax=Ramlibacter sp. WS9 TaxID=1882741 RepID=UPI0011412801|nr:hypothetical protein [Ramlibacter sp. WS9]ROZ79031.1 hypothetical protein EEB15_04955 [Ramlibacter sp. WS9]